jgi:UDP-MurNAc hydroxylase
MIIKLYRSSTVGINTGNFKILMDPWLTDGEYYGSWYHYPKFNIKKYINELNSYKAIFISHIHPDHCSSDTLKLLNKNIPIFIHEFHSMFLKKKIEKLGFSVHEIKHGVRTKIYNNTAITIYAADNCDPKLCYRFSGCANLLTKEKKSQQIDTLSIIDNKKTVILNVNDCPYELAESTFADIKKKFKKINALLLGYSGAGAYPQCFNNLKLKQKKIEMKKKEIFFLERAFKFIKDIRPEFYLPFAGTYCLAGKLAKLQSLRGVPTIDNAYEYLEKKIKKENIKNCTAIKINYEQDFNLINKKSSKKYHPVNKIKIQKYIENYLSKKKLEYELENYPKNEEIIKLSSEAFKRFKEKKLLLNIKFQSDILIKIKNLIIKLPNKGDDIEVKNLDYLKKNLINYVCYSLDSRLYKRLLLGPRYAHWNNAEIGSHIIFSRWPNVYERNIYESMSYFHI